MFRNHMNKLVPLATLAAVLGGARPTIADDAETKARLDSLKTSYGPGDEVTAKVTIESPTGGPMLGVKAIAIITVDGAELARTNVFPDDKGRAWVRFALPAKIAKGDGLLTIQVDGGG